MPGDNVELECNLHVSLALEVGSRYVHVCCVHQTKPLIIGLVSLSVRATKLVSRSSFLV